jgi:hypothetical protein
VTTAGAGWEWRETSVGDVLRSEALQVVAPHVFTSRALSFTADADNDYATLGRLFGVEGTDVSRVKQVHGRVVELRDIQSIWSLRCGPRCQRPSRLSHPTNDAH